MFPHLLYLSQSTDNLILLKFKCHSKRSALLLKGVGGAGGEEKKKKKEEYEEIFQLSDGNLMGHLLL